MLSFAISWIPFTRGIAAGILPRQRGNVVSAGVEMSYSPTSYHQVYLFVDMEKNLSKSIVTTLSSFDQLQVSLASFGSISSTESAQYLFS